ncbi:MAG: response regulator, partial [Proteobacteria bacterium]|nr:response regulator [Pseudomonadota bacterium]
MLKILFIDDEPVIRFIGKKTLEKAGFNVTVAEDADEGMDRFTSDEYDLVITDLAVPGQVGFSTVLKM